MDEMRPDQSIELTMDRIEREAKRAAQAKAEQARFGGAQDGRLGPAAEADALAARIASLIQCHRVPYKPRDWATVAARPRINIVRTQEREAEARQALHAYQPGWLAQLFGSDRDKRRQLAARVAEAASEDEHAYRTAWREAQAHNVEIDFACKLAELDMRTINESLAEHTQLSEAYGAVERFRFCSPAKGQFQVQIEALDLAAMPAEEAERLPQGRAVFRPAPIGKRNQMQGANVCAAALRFAVEMLGFLPLDAVEVVVHGDLRDPRSGLFERHPILQLTLTHAQAAATPFERAEPMALAAQLGARISWTIQGGFAPIELVGQPEAA
ncbi:hypothetical protein [Phenylobacterium sp.]|uniref:hypothetical protein n=1 Tax=Phenylobacterium sp. TaxID=1871053 RepID=UPI0027309942|nr:hypothetical protein [Phenylobacterium sp.]MDP1874380.1 hypothetical protein [Phenylobacterium sp.]MDP3489459.1 hypothetical protein [Phenylobacterium sp.]